MKRRHLLTVARGVRPRSIRRRRKILNGEMFKRRRGIELRRVVHPDLCIACGQPYRLDEHVLQQVCVGVTHQRCAGWWRNCDFARVPEKGIGDFLV